MRSNFQSTADFYTTQAIYLPV